MRVAAVFHKGERLRHIGHLDIQRAFMRAFRRSGLPVSYSNGFNPHILVTFASALSVGAVGEREMMEVKLDTPVAMDVFVEKMNHALPQDLQLSSARELDDRHPALMATLCAAEYELTLLSSDAPAMLAAAEGFLAQETIAAQRKTKSGIKEVDIRPLIQSFSVEDGTIRTVLTLTEAQACKPDMLVGALAAFAGCEMPRMQVVRKQLYGMAESGELAPLEAL